MLNGYGRTSRSTVSLALAPDGSVHVALKRTSTPPPAALACPAPMEQPSAPPDARNWLMAPCIACSNAANWLMGNVPTSVQRSEEHTSELQSRRDLVCRLLLE